MLLGDGGHGDEEEHGKGRVLEHLLAQNQVDGAGYKYDKADELDVEGADVERSGI